MERNKVLLEKVDTLENIEESLTRSMSVVNFSWCKETMGIFSQGLRTKVQRSSGFNKEDNKWDNFGLLYSLQ
jgi:hypothetical protein